MTKVIKFTKLRYVMFVVSIILLAVGITGISTKGFNQGIDFQAGISMRVQIAPVAFSVAHSGEGNARMHIQNNILRLNFRTGDVQDEYVFPFSEYPDLQSLTDAVESVPGVSVNLNAPADTETSRVLGLNYETPLQTEGVTVNMVRTSPEVEIEEIRGSFTELSPQIQVVGEPQQQEFIIRIEDPEEDPDFNANMSEMILSVLGDEFGEERVIEKQTDYVGPQFSAFLGRQSLYLGIFAMVLILAYIWFRFQLGYALSAITALVHDVLIMLGFIAVFQIEFSTATIAAVLTIIGYSLNDTIVIFDRIRENVEINRDTPLKEVIDLSITQSLGRTLITSLTTLIAVTSIYVFATGSIQDFALNLIVGIVIGTYSSMFVASPVFLGYMNFTSKMHRRRDIKKYGSGNVEVVRKDSSQKTAVSDQSSKAAPEKPVEIPSAERKLKGKRKKKKK